MAHDGSGPDRSHTHLITLVEAQALGLAHDLLALTFCQMEEAVCSSAPWASSLPPTSSIRCSAAELERLQHLRYQKKLPRYGSEGTKRGAYRWTRPTQGDPDAS